jgi:hypothetical protein
MPYTLPAFSGTHQYYMQLPNEPQGIPTTYYLALFYPLQSWLGLGERAFKNWGDSLRCLLENQLIWRVLLPNIRCLGALQEQ